MTTSVNQNGLKRFFGICHP